jgi:protein AroM
MAKRKLGLINVGQGPRIDNRSFVRNWFKAQGVDVEILEHACFEGMTWEEIHALEGPDYDPSKPMYSPDTRCGAFVHREGVYDFHLGEGWYEVWTPRKENMVRIQRCIDQLEAEGAEVILLCCCLRYPTHAFKSHVPVVFPYKCTFNYVKALADTMDNPQVGIVIGRGQNVERDMDMWKNNDWARNVDFHFAVGHCDGNGEKQLREAVKNSNKKLDLIVIWGYHTFDLRGGEVGPDECLELRYEKEFDCPVISSASAAFLFARGLMRPAIDEKKYYTPI